MWQKEDIQKAITLAAGGNLKDAVGAAFERTDGDWKPHPDCLVVGYSSGEAVICGILLAFYFEYHGTPKGLNIPADREFTNSLVDYVWPGAWYFVSASNKLTDEASWEAILVLLGR
jgi:hypothetical protein